MLGWDEKRQVARVIHFSYEVQVEAPILEQQKFPFKSHRRLFSAKEHLFRGK